MLVLTVILVAFSSSALSFPWTDISKVPSHSDSKGLKELESILRSPEIQDILSAELGSTGIKLHRADRDENSGCACVGYNCGCCVHAKAKAIRLDATVCVNITYLPKDYGITASLSINGRIIITETVSARNPPPICIDVPDLKKLASICLKFSNLTLTKNSLSGCISIQARLAYVIAEDIPLGCFTIPPSGPKQGRQPSQDLRYEHQGRQFNGLNLNAEYKHLKVPTEKQSIVAAVDDVHQRVLLRLQRK